MHGAILLQPGADETGELELRIEPLEIVTEPRRWGPAFPFIWREDGLTDDVGACFSDGRLNWERIPELWYTVEHGTRIPRGVTLAADWQERQARELVRRRAEYERWGHWRGPDG